MSIELKNLRYSKNKSGRWIAEMAVACEAVEKIPDGDYFVRGIFSDKIEKFPTWITYQVSTESAFDMNARDVQKQNIIEEHSHTQMERYFSPFSDCFQFLSLFRASKKDDWEMKDEVYANLEDRVQHYHFEGYADCDMDPELELPYDDTDRISATGTGVVTEKFTFDGVKYKARFKSDFVYGRYIVEDVSNTIEMQLLNDAEETLEEYHSIDEAERSKFLRVFCELADNFAMTYDALVEPLKVNDFQEGYALFLSDDYDIEIN